MNAQAITDQQRQSAPSAAVAYHPVSNSRRSNWGLLLNVVLACIYLTYIHILQGLTFDSVFIALYMTFLTSFVLNAVYFAIVGERN